MNVLFVTHIDSRPSMGVMYLSAVLRRAGHSTAVAHLHERSVARALASERFDAIALSYPSLFARRGAELSRRIRRVFDGPIFAGGPHATFCPEALLAGSEVDAACVGEGEAALPEALDAIAAGRSVAGLRGWWARRDGEIVRAPLRSLEPELDSLPFPDRDILSPHLTFGDRVQTYLFSRGCPFQCTYCFEPVYQRLFRGLGPSVRRRSVESAIEELVLVQRTRQVRLNMIYDDTFNLDPEWLEAFCRAYGEKVRVPFTCKIRPDLLDESTVALLARAGCALVFMGVETGNEHTRAKVLGRRVKDRSIVDAATWIRRHSMKLVTYNLAAIPGAGYEDDVSTLDLNLTCRPDMAMVMFLQPYAGTELHDKAIELGLWSPEDDERLERSGLGVYDRSPLRFTDDAERRRVENLRHLFALTLAWPALRPLIPSLVELPAGPLYARLCSLWYMRGHFGVLYPRMATLARLGRAAVLEKFPALRPFAGVLGPMQPAPRSELRR